MPAQTCHLPSMAPPDSARALSAPRFRAVLPEDLASMPDEPRVDVDPEAVLRWMEGEPNPELDVLCET